MRKKSHIGNIGNNGGGHTAMIAQCPHCKSMRIHKRKGFKWFSKWRCRKCRRVFFSPNWKIWYYPTGSPPRYAICKEEGWYDGVYID